MIGPSSEICAGFQAKTRRSIFSQRGLHLPALRKISPGSKISKCPKRSKSAPNAPKTHPKCVWRSPRHDQSTISRVIETSIFSNSVQGLKRTNLLVLEGGRKIDFFPARPASPRT